MIRRISIAFLVGIALASCDSNEDDATECEELLLGAGLPLSAGSEGTGENVKYAIEMAIADANADGGVDGSDVVLRIADDQSGTDQTAVEDAAEELAADDCIAAVIGHLNSNATLWAQDVYDQEEIVNFTPVSTASSIAANSEWTFRNITHNGYKGRFLAGYAQSSLGIERIGVIFDDDNFGTDLKSFFVEEASEIGLTIVDEFSYTRIDLQIQVESTIEEAVESLLADGAQSIYVSGVLNEGVIAVNTIRTQVGADMPIIWSGWEEPLLIEEAGPNANGVHVPIHRVYDSSNPAVEEFRDRFEDTYGEPPGAFAPFAYDATLMVIQAMREVGTDREAIRDHLAGIRSESTAYQGLTGLIYFDADGDLAEHYVSALEIIDGEFVPAGN